MCLLRTSHRIKPEEKQTGIRKTSNTGQESGYGSDGATTNSSRASPRGSLEGAEVPGTSVRDKIMASQTRTETPSPPTMTKDAIRVHKPVNPPLLMPKPNKSATNIAPKTPARLKLSGGGPKRLQSLNLWTCAHQEVGRCPLSLLRRRAPVFCPQPQRF